MVYTTCAGGSPAQNGEARPARRGENMQTAMRAQAASPSPDRSLTRTKLLFFAAAGLSFLLSVFYWFGGDRERGLFVGIWVPSILSAGSLLVGGLRRA
jgi:hypothetical protein